MADPAGTVRLPASLGNAADPERHLLRASRWHRVAAETHRPAGTSLIGVTGAV